MEEEEVAVYKLKDIAEPFAWMSVTELYEGAEFAGDRGTVFQQGELGDCWLAAAIESLRNIPDSFSDVVLNENTFKFWQPPGSYREITLESDKVPAKQVDDVTVPVFMRSVGGSECWGVLLEKAYAKWVQSYEGLEGGFWSDAIQSFTGGGIIERIKMEDKPENLFDIMLHSFNASSSLCCIIKKEGSDVPERYHSCCCINIVEMDEATSRIAVRDPYTSECQQWSYDDFVDRFHRLDMCHRSVDHLSQLQNRSIGDGAWEAQVFQVDEDDVELSIELTDTDDDGDGCTFVLEMVQKLKPDEGETLPDLQPKPWDFLSKFELYIDDDGAIVKFPQETFVHTLEPGSHTISVSRLIEDPSKPTKSLFIKVFSKKNYSVTQV